MDEREILELVRLAQVGDRDALGELVTRLERTVYAIVFRRLRNASEAAEVTQDVFVQVVRKLGQLREAERFPGWLKRIAIRMAINRAVRRPKEVCSDGEPIAMARAAGETPFDRMVRSEKADAVWSGLDELRDLDRKTLVAFYIEGQSLQEMSDAFASPIGTIKRRLHMARNRLRDHLAKRQAVS